VGCCRSACGGCRWPATSCRTLPALQVTDIICSFRTGSVAFA
jgi:hypothetical protein